MASKREQLAYSLLIIAAVAFVLLWKKSPRTAETTQVSCDVASIVAGVPDDWKTYRSEELGYVLFYPTDWTRSAPDSSVGHEVDFHAPDEKPLTTSLAIVKDTRAWEQIETLYAEQWSHDFPGMTASKIVIGGLNGTRYDYPQADNSDIYLRRGNEVLEIVINRRSSAAVGEILDNIRFTS